MKFTAYTALVLTVLVISIHAEAQTVKRTQLSNGLTILTKPSTANSIVSVVVTFKMGSLYETDEQAGLSTLMQDTIIKGTTSRSSEQIALELESMGTRLGTSANREYGSISLQSTSLTLHKSLAILYDIIRNPTFPEDAVALQKNLQKRTILIRDDQPLYRAVDLMVETFYGDHPFHKSRLGYPGTIDAFTREDIIAFYKKSYVPGNMVITVVGNYDEDALIADIGANLGTMVPGPAPAKAPGSMPRSTVPMENVEKRETAASWFAIGWPSATIGSGDYYVMDVLDSITGGSMNSRLFVAIREKRGLAYQVASFVNARLESGIYVAYIGTKPSTYEEAKKVLIEEVLRMANEPATAEEIINAKNYLKGMNIMEEESNAGQASKYGHLEILGLGWDFSRNYNEGIERVTVEDVLAAGKKYLVQPYKLGAVLSQ